MKERDEGESARLRWPPGAGRDRARAVPSPRVSSAPGNLLRAHYSPGPTGWPAAPFILPSVPSGRRMLLEVPSGLFVFALGWTVWTREGEAG